MLQSRGVHLLSTVESFKVDPFKLCHFMENYWRKIIFKKFFVHKGGSNLSKLENFVKFWHFCYNDLNVNFD